MIYGHICRNSLKSARETMDENHSEVVCMECGEVTGLTIVDNGFGDDFGGVSDYQCETKCCGSCEWLGGCSSCDKVEPLKKLQDEWYCTECYDKLMKEQEDLQKGEPDG